MTALKPLHDAARVRSWLRQYNRQEGNARTMDLCRILDEGRFAAEDLSGDVLKALAATTSSLRGAEVMVKVLRGGEPRTRWIRWMTTRLDADRRSHLDAAEAAVGLARRSR